MAEAHLHARDYLDPRLFVALAFLWARAMRPPHAPALQKKLNIGMTVFGRRARVVSVCGWLGKPSTHKSQLS